MTPKSQHAKRRCQQRAIHEDAIEATQEWGQSLRLEQGRVGEYLGHKAVARAKRAGIEIKEHMNILLITGQDGVMITAIKTKHLKKINRKRKKARRKNWNE